MSQDQNLGNGANAWGQSPADFQVDPGIRAQVSAAAARAQKPAHKGKRVGRRPKPKPPKPRLAPEVDEYHRFSDTLVAELETEERYEELEHGSEEGDAETNEMRHSDVSDALVNTMIEMMVEVCGPVPSCGMCMCRAIIILCPILITHGCSIIFASHYRNTGS